MTVNKNCKKVIIFSIQFQLNCIKSLNITINHYMIFCNSTIEFQLCANYYIYINIYICHEQSEAFKKYIIIIIINYFLVLQKGLNQLCTICWCWLKRQTGPKRKPTRLSMRQYRPEKNRIVLHQDVIKTSWPVTACCFSFCWRVVFALLGTAWFIYIIYLFLPIGSMTLKNKSYVRTVWRRSRRTECLDRR